MSKNIFTDMTVMHDHYDVHDAVDKMDADQLEAFLEFRIKFLQEELDETQAAFMNDDAEEVVDGLIDLIVIAAGTLDLFNVDGSKAWNEVLEANMTKRVGVKESRPNPFGLPDLIKPEGWKGPSHETNHGLLGKALKKL